MGVFVASLDVHSCVALLDAGFRILGLVFVRTHWGGRVQEASTLPLYVHRNNGDSTSPCDLSSIVLG
jgi:hypothetical protein